MPQRNDSAPLRLVSLCSGIGGFELAALLVNEAVGAPVYEITAQVEIDPDCVRVLETHFPDVRRFGDMRQVKGVDFGAVEIVVAGLPCQPFSNAGKRRGKDDDRYLWPEMLRIVADRETGCWPTWLLIENVAQFARVVLDDVLADLERAGYAGEAFILPACAVGAPHERERVFIVAHCCGGAGAGGRDASVAHTSRPRRRQDTGGASGDEGPHEGWATLQDHEPDGGGQGAGRGANVAYSQRERRGGQSDPAAGNERDGTAPERQEGASGSQQSGEDGGGADVADADADRQRVGSGQYVALAGCAGAPDTRTTGQDVADTSGERQREPTDAAHAVAGGGHARAQSGRRSQRGVRARTTQSRLGRAVNGFSGWVDRLFWPAYQGQEQYDYETPRTVGAGEVHKRTARLKQLGNAVVPAQVYPFLLAIAAAHYGALTPDQSETKAEKEAARGHAVAR